MDLIGQSLEAFCAKKTNDELQYFHSSGDISEIAYQVLENEMASRGMLVPARPQTAQSVRVNPLALRALWEGESFLVSAYWGVGVGVLCLLKALFILFSVSFFTRLGISVWIPFMVFTYVSIWRCADNVGWKGWSYIARGIVIIGSLQIIYLFLHIR